VNYLNEITNNFWLKKNKQRKIKKITDDNKIIKKTVSWYIGNFNKNTLQRGKKILWPLKKDIKTLP
jgi:hypothetical protein